ncbi:Rz1-like lysis system protein LysC [Pragia fontium]|uniref:Rz1-like lysis system protein LysC n=1 Tax=Pragia fontium TaxID=82985 RepID=UPI003D142353
MIDNVAEQKQVSDNRTKICKNNLQPRRSIVSALLCLTLSLSGCVNESPRSRPPLLIPKALFRPCLAPDYQVRYYGDYPCYVAELLAVIEQCNNQISAIEKVDNSRGR